MKYNKANYDFNNLPEWITFLRKDLDLKSAGINLVRLHAGKGYSFLHRHKRQEEIYIVLSGNGMIHIDGENLNLVPGDIVRVDPSAERALKAGDENDLVCLVVGAMPVEGYPKNEDSKTLIDDGIRNYEKRPPWLKGKKFNTAPKRR